jgi:acetoin utilization deacetylase AcuC-like enzyme
MHSEKNFPLKKMNSSLDIGLPDFADDTHYLSLLYQNLPKVFELSKPDIVLYCAGVDVVKVFILIKF